MTATSAPFLAYRAGDPVEAHALAARLADAGIDAQVLGEFLQGAYSGLQLGGMNTPEVWTSEENRAAAEAVIQQWRREHAAELADGAARSTKLQFSTAGLLALTTAIAILSALYATEYVSFAEGLTVTFYLFVCAVFLLAIAKTWRKLMAARRDDADGNS